MNSKNYKAIVIIIFTFANSIKILMHEEDYPPIKCQDVTEKKLVYIEAGIMNRGRGDFWRNDVHLEGNVEMIWCEINHGDNFYYSEYLKDYGTDFMNMRNESVKCLMEFTKIVCK